MSAASVAKIMIPTTLLGAGSGAAMSMVAKPKYRERIIGTGVAVGALVGAGLAAYWNEWGHKLGSSDSGVSAPPACLSFVRFP